MSKVILSGHIVVSESDMFAVRQALPEHMQATRNEAGCLVFNVEEDPIKTGKFHVYEEFVDIAAFELHQERAGASDWGKVSRNVERYYKVDGLAD